MKARFLQALFCILLVFNLFIGFHLYSSYAAGDTEDSAYSNITVLTRALQLLRRDYVDEEKVSYRELTYGAMRGMLSSLDPHSQFMEPAAFKSMQEDTRSQFGGLGIVVALKDGVITIVSPMEDTPASKAGLLPGDQILQIDGNSTEKMDLTDAVRLLRGDPGEVVTLTILRPSSREVEEYTLERAIIPVQSVRDARLLPDELSGDYRIGYIRIVQFNEPTSRELGERLDQLEEQGMQALVLDLRNNPGGLLNSAVEVCGQFLPPNKMVVYTEGRQASQREKYHTPRNGKTRDHYPIAILINNGSASGAEIVAGALRDLNRAIVIGETSFGKGSVQSVVQLPDGSAIRFTTAKYYTPSRQVIHEKGVTPNIIATMTPEQERALVLRRNSDSLDDEQRAEIKDIADPQLERAVDALRGVMIFNDKLVASPAEEEQS